MSYFVRLWASTMLKYCVRVRLKICNQTIVNEVVIQHHRFNKEKYRAKEHGKLNGIKARACPNRYTF